MLDIGEIEALRREIERLTVLASKERGLIDAILNQSPHGIIACDTTGKLVLHNKAAERIWAGSATADNVEGWGQYRAFHPDGRPYEASDWSMARCLSRRETVVAEEISILRFDDSPGFLLGSCAPIHGADGELQGAVSVFADITEFKNTERERERLADELARVGEFREQLLSIVAHDLRNPLGVIVMAAESLQRGGDLPEKHLRTIARITRSADRMGRMISSLLDFTAGTIGGGIPVAPRPVNFSEIIRRMVEEAELSNPGRSVTVETVGDLRGEWDPDRLAQVMSNLLGNALQHGADPIRVDARGEVQEVVLEVSNHGPPIPADLLPVVFQPFRRRTQDHEGLGLGLFIVEAIVLAHGGRIDVRSSEREGTTFTVRLPHSGKKAESALRSSCVREDVRGPRSDVMLTGRGKSLTGP